MQQEIEVAVADEDFSCLLYLHTAKQCTCAQTFNLIKINNNKYMQREHVKRGPPTMWVGGWMLLLRGWR